MISDEQLSHWQSYHTFYIFTEMNTFQAARAIWEHQGKQVASNGAVMRTSIVGVHNYWNTDEVVKNAIEITKTTHYDPR